MTELLLGGPHTHSRPTYPDQFPSHQGNSCSQRSFRLHFGFGSKDSVQKMGDNDVTNTSLTKSKGSEHFKYQAVYTVTWTHRQIKGYINKACEILLLPALNCALAFLVPLF